MGDYWLFLVILLVVAAMVRGDFAFSVLYLFLGAYVIGRWWSGRALANISCHRYFEPHAFLGENVPVQLEVSNMGWLPVAWLRLYESLPVELTVPNAVNHVITLGARGRVSVMYTLHTRKRGYYPIGPLFASTGDLLGLSREQQNRGVIDHLTVYPQIIPLTHPRLPSRSPQGTLRSNQPIFEDPSRVLSKRDYVAGDSLRRIDWKASATVGRLQVKQFEPSIALETAIFLNLHSPEYDPRYRIDSQELAIVIAASLASWIVGHRQTVGLVTNGVAQLDTSQYARPLPPRKGRGHLIHVLEILARLQPAETIPIADLIRYESLHLAWGATIIVITGRVDDNLIDELFQTRKRGLNAVIILAGRVADLQEIQRKLATFGFPAYAFQNERDLDIWRK
jgi:uncharacterized protein (DUF58 family)